MKLEKELKEYTNEELEALIHEHGQIFVEYESGNRLSLHKFELVNTNGAGACTIQFLEKEDEEGFNVNQPEHFPLFMLDKALQAFRSRAESKIPLRAWPAHGGPHGYSMFEIREMVIDLQKK